MRQISAALVVMAVLATSASTAWSCKKGSGTDTPTGPTSAPPPNEATVVSRNGCEVTYTCPNVDINGNANPETPTFDRLTLSTGTSSSCRVDNYRNVRPNPGDNIPIQFTIRNPNRDYFWSARGNCQLGTRNPASGPADPAGPFQVTVGFGGPGSSTATCDGRQFASGDNFTQPLNLEIRRGSSQAVVAACGVTVWGYVTPGR